MNVSAIDKFEQVKDVLIFVLHSTEPVTALMIENLVLDLSRTRINALLKSMVEAEYLNCSGGFDGKKYTATHKTMQLFGKI